MAIYRNGTVGKYKMLHNGNKLKKGYHNSTVKIWSAGSTVLYYVDTEESHIVEYDNDLDVLNPTAFTPAKEGWTFVGWREDTAASGDVLTEKIMNDEPITLYAVFEQTITLSYNGNGSTSGSTASQTGSRYYLSLIHI